ncbi:hypothetical protein [Streptomyces sp. NPDC001401]|uniref:hypothetical protein n=1 Tax=Streptomyces sp. NPDC001401 TaxID=3364570 RepID=UPI0036B6983E
MAAPAARLGARQIIHHRVQVGGGKLCATRSIGPDDLSSDLVRESLTTAESCISPRGASCP